MRFSGSREGLEPGQYAIVDDQFRWTDENGTEHRAPTAGDIRRQAISSFDDRNVYTVTESDTVFPGNAHVAFVTELTGGQTIHIEDTTCVPTSPYAQQEFIDAGPDGLALAENMAVLLIRLNQSNPDNSNVEETIAESDGENHIIQASSSSDTANNTGVYMIVVDYWHFQQQPDLPVEPSIVDFKVALSFRVWWE